MFAKKLCFWILLVCSALHAELPLISKVPHILWQTYKSCELPTAAKMARRTWIDLNPEFSCVLFDDGDIEHYIQRFWPPDYLNLFYALPIGAMKADLWRYMILAREGGVYSDIDSVCLQSIREWTVNNRASSSHVLLLDLDADQQYFCQWTLACTPNHPAMQQVCRTVLMEWKKEGVFPLTEEGTIDVMKATGPAIFTKAVCSYIGTSTMSASKILRKYVKEKEYRKHLNRLGIYFAPKGFFSGQGAQNLFWGSSQCLGDEYNSWAAEAQRLQR